MADDAELVKVAAGKLRAAEETRLAQEMLRDVLKTYEGRAALFDVLAECKIYSDGFNNGDPAFMAFEAGKRHIGISLLKKLLTVDPPVYIVMQNEAEARKRDLEQRFKVEQD